MIKEAIVTIMIIDMDRSIKKVIKHFEGKGLKIQPYEAEAVSLGFFKDLDDNQLYFVEEKK